MMPNSFSETLQQERARLLRSASDWLETQAASRKTNGLDEILAEQSAMRQSVDEILTRQAGDSTKEELILLQSALHQVLAERFQRGVKEYCDRRFKKLSEQSRRDTLTGLLNRAAFEERMNEEVARALRYGRQLTLVMFDVDDFKSVNDRFGHQTGDHALVQVARALRASFRLSDPVFRYGGDEFVAICPETPGAEIENALKRVAGQQIVWREEDATTHNIKISWGVASLPADAVSDFGLIQIADQRLYRLKQERHRQAAA